jgi:O-acetyl-ADP-ribose deacetylase (regulator of RNase III)
MGELPERIVLVDRDARMVAAWREVLRDVHGVEIHHGDFFAHETDAMVAPGNSFGIMDGGLDRTIVETLGVQVERRVREAIEARHHGELHVGCAEVVSTDDTRWPWLIYAPTMRVPDDASRSTNAYTAMRAILLAVRAHQTATGIPIRSLLCTGVGAMPPRRSAAQMRVALRQLRGAPRTGTFAEILEAQRLMRTFD